MNPPDDACGDYIPVFDERSQALGIEYKSRSVVRRPRIAAGKEAENALGAGIHSYGVPTAIQNQYRIRLKLRHKKLHGAARGLQFRCIETSVTVEWRIAGCQQQRIALTQWNLQGLGKTHDHLPAGLGAASLDAAEMTR